MARFGCFTADTPVVMADGTTAPISQVQAGDEVLAFDPTTGHTVPGQVVEAFTHEDVALLEVRTSAGRVETTATHPFYVEGKGYTPAQDLRAGDLLRTPTGERVVVEQLSYTGQRATVHNLHVKGYNNYHVHTSTGTPVLVHNNGPSGCGDAAEIARLTQRVDEIHSVHLQSPSGRIAATRRTTAVLSTREGIDVLSSGTRDLSPAQQSFSAGD